MSNLNILIVDDEPGIRSGVKRILRDFSVDYPFMDEHISFEIYEAATGEDAIEMIDNSVFDIILLDNKLPGIQGIDVLEYIRKKQYDMVVTMITSHASLDVAVKATRYGAYDFVPKPFTPQELKSSIESITKHLFLKRMTKRMHKEGKSIRFQFLSVLSHELKAPLNVIEGYMRMIKEKQLGSNAQDYDEIIDRSLERVEGMRHMIMNFLDLTQIDSDKKKREVLATKIHTVIRAAVDTMRPYAIQKDVEIDIHSEEDLIIQADKDELEIIFNNLISNAVKFNKNGGRVDIYICKEDNMAAIRVEDTGIGIDKDDLEDVFGEFVRIKNTQTQNVSGSGLGLSIVKRIVTLHQGEIKIDSEINKGTKVVVKLPLTELNKEQL